MVASHLGKTVSDLIGSITYAEFVGWVVFLEMDRNRITKMDHYLAQIATEVRRTMMKEPGRLKHSDMLLQFKDVALEEGEMKPRQTPEESEAIWCALLGIDRKKKKKKKKKKK